MKKLVLWTVVACPLLAQSITGTWQGTLHTPARELRTVVKISTTGADSLKVAFYSIDQGGQPLPGTVAIQGSTVKLSIPGIGGTYEGKVSADGASITGTWTQGPNPLPLNLARATNATAWAIPEPPAPPQMMPADANPAFEVATIKPSKPGEGLSIQVRGAQVSTTGMSVSQLITFAYGFHARQVTGGPAWLEAERYDVLAKPDVEGQPSTKQLRGMMQKLLADRFKMISHRDKKELSAYTITVGKAGPKLTRSEGDPNGLPGLGFRAGVGIAFNARNATIADFAGFMQQLVLDRPVVDKTGIAGRYDFTLNWTPDQDQFNGRPPQSPTPAAGSDAPPDLFTAIQQQLGLKLESARTPVEVLVIDHVEKPSDN